MFATPQIAPVGLSGVLVSFADRLEDRANIAAISLRAQIDALAWPEITETASTLVSTYLAVDLVTTPFEEIAARLQPLLSARDWHDIALPGGRKLWTLPMCFGTERAPQLADTCQAAGLSEAQGKAALMAARTRVITLGYAPGQPYLGLLGEVWNVPRQTDLTPQVPAGALVLAIRQFVLFTAAMPTGWRHVGQTAFRPFDAERGQRGAFRPGDEGRFEAISRQELEALEAGDSWGGATWEALP